VKHQKSSRKLRYLRKFKKIPVIFHLKLARDGLIVPSNNPRQERLKEQRNFIIMTKTETEKKATLPKRSIS